MITETQRALYRRLGIDPEHPNPDGSDYRIMDHLDTTPAAVDWDHLKCRHGCAHPVVGLYRAPDGCLCFPDPVQALCGQHAIKGIQNNEMYLLLARPIPPE